MKLMAMDIIGTINELIKRALKEILLLVGILMFGLSAPLLFTVGAEAFVWQNPDSLATFGTVYIFLGPFACAIWMVFICHWHTVRQWQRKGELDTWREDHGGIGSTVGKSIWFMVSGFFGSVIAEGILLVVMHSMFPDGLSAAGRTNAMIFFAIAPFAVFAPVLLVLLSRYIRRDEYAA